MEETCFEALEMAKIKNFQEVDRLLSVDEEFESCISQQFKNKKEYKRQIRGLLYSTY